MSARRALLAVGLACVLPLGRGLAQRGGVRGTIDVPSPGITGVVVYLVPEGGEPLPTTPMAAVMDQRDLKFVPRVIAVTPGSTVTFPNSDPVMHNVFHPSRHTDAFDLGTYPEGERRAFTFADEGAFVIFCHVHPEMIGYVLVIASPHLAVSDDAGHFRIEGVAPGTYHLRTWHRRLQTLDQLVTVTAGGAVTVTLAPAFGFPVEPRATRAGQRPH